MALPIPGANNSSNSNDENKKKPAGLPKVERQGLPIPSQGLPIPQSQRSRETTDQKEAPKRSRPAPRDDNARRDPSRIPANRPVKEPVKEEVPEGWAIDPRTGVKYKKMGQTDPGAVKAFKESKGKGLTLEQMRKFVPDEEFDVDNLNDMANDFLGHLRVPPSKDEIKRMRLEREKRLTKEAKEKNVSFENEEDEES